MDYRTINASSFGVPQHRRRVFLVCGPVPIRWPDATHGDPSTFGQADLFSRSLKPWTTVRDALDLDVYMDGGRNSEANPNKERPSHSSVEPAPTVGGRGNLMIGSGLKGSAYVRVIGGGTRGHGMAEWKPRDCTDTPAPTVNAMQGSTAAIYLERPSPTVTAQEVKGTRAHGDPPDFNGGPDRESDALWLGTGRRRLTVAECAVLQDFPEGYPWQGTKTAQYRQIGNAWPRTFGRVLGRAILEAQ